MRARDTGRGRVSSSELSSICDTGAFEKMTCFQIVRCSARHSN